MKELSEVQAEDLVNATNAILEKLHEDPAILSMSSVIDYLEMNGKTYSLEIQLGDIEC